MATNDLMMKIQLLVESGKSTAELDRLSKSLKQLTSELNSLETTKITPLTRDLQEIKQVAQTLRNVNNNNFGKSLDIIKQSMIGLGVGTSNLDKLRESYQKLNEQLKSPIAKTLVSDIQSSQKNISDLRTNEIIPLKNDIRRLQATKGINKVLRMDNLSASLRVAKAELAKVSNEISKLLKLRAESSKKDSGVIFTDKDQQSLSNLRADYKRLNDEIIKGNLDLAKTNQDIVKQYNGQIALKQRELVTSKNILTSETNMRKNLQSQLKAETDKEKSIHRQITYYSKLTTSDALAKSLELQQQLAQSKTKQVGLKKDITDTESLTKAELARIQAMEKANTTAMKKANADIKNQSGNLTTLGRLFGKSGGAVREFGDAIFFAFGPQMAGFIAAAGIANAVREVTVAFFEANKSVEHLLRGLNAIRGGQGVVLFNQLVDSANRLGIPLKQVSQSFLEVQAATTGTNFEGQKTKELFDALANALTVTGADAVQFNRGFRAMGQILSKDQLYAEELRQQLSEALPGAVQVFARALDVSPKQLLRFIEAGAIEGDNLRRTLALVTKELEKTYKVANEQDFTFTQKAALAQNALNLLFVELGNTGIWRAFGNSLLLARDTFVELKDITSEYSVYVKAIFATLSQIVDETSSDIKRASDNISENISLSNVEFSPAGLIRNFKNFFALLGPEARDALKPVEDAIANIDFSRITVALTATVRAAIESIGILIVSAIDSLNQLGPLADVIGQSFVTLGARIKSIYVEVSNFISLKIEELSAEFTKSKFNVRWTQLFGSAEELNALFKEIEGLDQRYKEAAKSADERSRKSQENYNQEKSKLESLNNILQSQSAIWSRTTQSAFEGIGQRLLDAFNKLEPNQSFFNIIKKAQEDANALQKIYDIDLNYQATLKAKSLQISKEQAKLDKELLKIQNDYNDAIMEVTANKYKRWAEQGQITQEGADFLIQSAKGESARKAWNQAQDAVDSYNAAVKEGSGVSKDTIDILKQQASELLSIAANRAKEIGDEYKLKQAYDAQKSLLEEQKKQIGGIENVVSKAEGAGVKTELKPIEDNTVSSFVSTVQEQIARQPQPMITVGLKLGPSELTPLLPYNSSSVETKARGGLIPGGYSNRDSVHALLAPGEFVIPSNIVKALSPSFFYDLIRSRGLKIPQVNARDNITIPHNTAGAPDQQSAQPIIINAAGKQIHLSGSREAANQLAKLLTQTGRAL